MRRIKLFFGIALIGLLGAGIFTSCEEDETFPLPTITFTNDVDSVHLDPGDSTHTITGTITAEGDLNYVKYFKVTDQGETQLDMVEEFDNPQNYNFSYTVTGISQDMTIKVEVTDEENQTISRNFDIYFTPPEELINSYTDKILGVALKDGSSEDLFSIETGESYTYNYVENNSIKDSADIVFGHAGLTKALAYKLLSPDYQTSVEIHGGGTLPNTTNYQVVTDGYTFEDITAEDIQNISDLTSVEVTIVEGDIVAFITEFGHKGFLKVTSISNEDGDVGNNDDELTFDVKAIMASELE